jgi:anaerobic selenocysteine-containing dehydrogenase
MAADGVRPLLHQLRHRGDDRGAANREGSRRPRASFHQRLRVSEDAAAELLSESCRFASPPRFEKRSDGSFEAIDWDTAIREIAARLAEQKSVDPEIPGLLLRQGIVLV